jgi:hypothetical protein
MKIDRNQEILSKYEMIQELCDNEDEAQEVYLYFLENKVAITKKKVMDVISKFSDSQEANTVLFSQISDQMIPECTYDMDDIDILPIDAMQHDIATMMDKRLNSNELLTVLLRYGFYNDRCYSIKNICNILNLSYARICQLLTRATEKLRCQFIYALYTEPSICDIMQLRRRLGITDMPNQYLDACFTSIIDIIDDLRKKDNTGNPVSDMSIVDAVMGDDISEHVTALDGRRDLALSQFREAVKKIDKSNLPDAIVKILDDRCNNFPYYNIRKAEALVKSAKAGNIYQLVADCLDIKNDGIRYNALTEKHTLSFLDSIEHAHCTTGDRYRISCNGDQWQRNFWSVARRLSIREHNTTRFSGYDLEILLDPEKYQKYITETALYHTEYDKECVKLLNFLYASVISKYKEPVQCKEFITTTYLSDWHQVKPLDLTMVKLEEELHNEIKHRLRSRSYWH